MRKFLTSLTLADGGVTAVNFDFIQQADLPGGAGLGSVTTVSVVSANGISGTVATATTTPAITLTIGAGAITNAQLAGLIQASKLVGTDIATVGTITAGVWNGTTIAIANGGTGATTANAAYNALSPMTTGGDMEYFSAESIVAVRLPGNTSLTPKFLVSAGTGAVASDPAWRTINASDVPTLNQNTTGTALNVTGTVAIGNGGTGATIASNAFANLSPLSTGGDLLYYDPSAGNSRLAGNTTTTKKFLTQTGLGAASAAPAWAIIVPGDVPTLNQNTTGNAATATALQTGRTINGTTFDGTANITITAAAGTLTGTTLNSTVVTSSLTSVGTIATGVWQGTAIAAAYLPSLDGITVPAADVSMNSHKVTNVTDPASAQDAATKHYVDAAMPRGYIDGLLLSQASTTTIGIAAGVAKDKTNAVSMAVTTAWTKSTGAWAAGSTSGGLDTGSIAASTWYKVFIIAKTDGTTDFIFTTAAVATGPAMPSGYTYFRYIGSVRTDASSHFLAFTQVGDKFIWTTIFGETISVNATFTQQTLTGVPAGVSVTAALVFSVSNVTYNVALGILSGLASSGNTLAAGLYVLESLASVNIGNGTIMVQTDTGQHIYTAVTTTSGTSITMCVHWYIDPRGRDL